MAESRADDVSRFTWLGAEIPHLDEVAVSRCGPVIFGSFGGSTTAGQTKNEDSALVWSGVDGEFAALLDAHGSADSARTVMEILDDHRSNLIALLNRGDLWALNASIIDILTSSSTARRFEAVRGETSLLVCARWRNYLSWLSVGDNLVYVLHPDFERLGQVALNSRQFFEWVGASNSLSLDIPAYSQGVRVLRWGTSEIIMVTDGLLEFPTSLFAEPRNVYRHFRPLSESVVLDALEAVRHAQGRDSSTVLAWSHDNDHAPLEPTA